MTAPNYESLLKLSLPQHREPLVWRLPGCSAAGKTVLCNGAALSVARDVQALGGRQVLLIIGRHVFQTEGGTIIRIALERAGIAYEVFTDIPAEPHYEVVERVQETMRGSYDAVIGVGGGSVMDIAKLAAHGAGGGLAGKLSKNDFSEKRLPLVLLPTTAGTGSEISPYAVLTMNEKKVFYTSPNLLPDVALVDPLLTVSAPLNTTIATAFDTMTHGLEGAMARPVAYSEALAAESTALILEYLPRAAANGLDLEARYQLSMASVMGMMAYVTGGGLYAHSISYILTLEKGLPHGAGCGFALPYTLAMNETEILPVLDKVTARCFGRCGPEGRRRLMRRVQALFIALGMPASLQAMGYLEEDMSRLAEKLLSQYPRKNNPRQITPNEAAELFAAMYNGAIPFSKDRTGQ